MAKRKRKLTAAQKAEKARRRREFMTIFINGKMKRVRRPPTIDGIPSTSSFDGTLTPFFFIRRDSGSYSIPKLPQT